MVEKLYTETEIKKALIKSKCDTVDWYRTHYNSYEMFDDQYEILDNAFDFICTNLNINITGDDFDLILEELENEKENV